MPLPWKRRRFFRRAGRSLRRRAYAYGSTALAASAKYYFGRRGRRNFRRARSIYRKSKFRYKTIRPRRELKLYYTEHALTNANRMLSNGTQDNNGHWFGHGTASLDVTSTTVAGAQGVGGSQIVGDKFFCKYLKINLEFSQSGNQFGSGSNYYFNELTVTVYILLDRHSNSGLTAETAAPELWLETPDDGPQSFRKRGSGRDFRVLKKHTMKLRGIHAVENGTLQTRKGHICVPISTVKRPDPEDETRWDHGVYLLAHLDHPDSTVSYTLNYNTRLSYTDA